VPHRHGKYLIVLRTQRVQADEQHVHWEGVAPRRTPDHPSVAGFAAPKAAYIAREIGGGQPQPTMLEVGAGSGHLSVALQRYFNLTCLDFSANMLAMHPLPEERKLLGDAQDLQFPDKSFDVVCCANLLHHLEDPKKAVAEFRRVARKHVVLLEPNARNPLMWAFAFLKKEENGALKFDGRYLRSLGGGMCLHAFATQGIILPNAMPPAMAKLARPFDIRFPLGFYNICIFDV
jgi:SAM-dependent methyltransferase